jgi:histidyl-tRNA synthetase
MINGVKGATDFYPEEEAVKQAVFSSLKRTAESFGFRGIATPVIENFELLSKKQGDEIRSQIFTLEKKGDEELAMRAEFTPSFARLFIEKQKMLVKPVKWFCIDRVWRYERPQAGRQREFYQFNVELYGSPEPVADAEIISLAVDALKNLGLKEADFVVKVNSRKLLQGIAEDFAGKGGAEELIRVIDKKSKVSAVDFRKMLEGAGVKECGKLIKLLEADNLKEVKVSSPLAKEGLDELKKVLGLLQYKCVKASISTARGLSYYTGTVFEIFDKDEKLRSVCGGGRYDSMIMNLGGEPAPAVGFGMGYSTLSLLLAEKKALPAPVFGPDIFIAVIDEDKKALEVASVLRRNYSVVVNLIKRNLGNQIKYANAVNAKNLLVIGPEEAKTGKAVLKNLKTGKEKEIKLSDIGSEKL